MGSLTICYMCGLSAGVIDGKIQPHVPGNVGRRDCSGTYMTAKENMRFNIVSDDGKDEVVFRNLRNGHCYVSAYGKRVSGKPPLYLNVGESCVKVFALSGQKPTNYKIVRVE